MAREPPRWLGPHDAASHVGLAHDAFRRRVKAGKLPQPSYAHGPRNPRWDREALDAAMEGAATPARRPLQGAIDAILEEGRRKAAHKRMMEQWRARKSSAADGGGA